MTLGEAAAALAYRGWPVFPCRRRGKRPLTPHGFQDATTDPEQIKAWWKRWPKANIGYATGNLVVVEVDGELGLRTRTRLTAEGRTWPVTLTSMSGRPGLHFYYRPPSGVRVANAAGLSPAGRGIGPGIDVRGHGGYVVVPPSVHPSGRVYRWSVRAEPAPLPLWMLEALRPPGPVLRPREGEVTTAYAEAALEGECEAVRTAPDGTLNDTLNRAAFKVGTMVPEGLSEDAARSALLRSAVQNGHPERSALRTIDSGLRAGMARPR